VVTELRARSPGIRTTARICVAVALPLVCAIASGAARRPFTVAEEIELAHFGDPYTLQAEAVQWSPNGDYVAVNTERGRLDIGRPEAQLRVYRTRDIREFVRRAGDTAPPLPVWSISRATERDGPIITQWHWLADSTGLAFLEAGANGSHCLMLADLKGQTVQTLTSAREDVRAFDIRDGKHFVYAIADRALQDRAAAERASAAVVGTGRSLPDLLFPVDEHPEMAVWADRSQLWAVVEGRRFEVRDKSTGQRITLFEEGQRQLALAPDGQSLITVLPVAEVPEEWTTLYPAPHPAYPYGMHAGMQDLNANAGSRLIGRYVRIDLSDGSIQEITGAPTAVAAGWWSGGVPAWSDDGRAVLLPGTFVVSATHSPARPCTLMTVRSPPSATCVETMKGATPTGYEAGAHLLRGLRFVGHGSERVFMSYAGWDGSEGSRTYVQVAGGRWSLDKQVSNGSLAPVGGMQVTVREGINDPPVLVATDMHSRATKSIWDPNPQLKQIELGELSVFKWKDKTGRDWKGGLIKPVPFDPARRYPLVIQTHGFSETEFRPSGVFPTAFAARALAGAGIVVLQVEDCTATVTLQEGPCNVAGYQSAVEQLVKVGLIDPEKVGIIGFSRTCYYVMDALTMSSLHITAASITDGIMVDYLQYLMAADLNSNTVANEYLALVGSAPFGAGLQQWMERSPLFNAERISAPLQVVSGGPASLLYMWGPYAALRYLHKPVDLLMLNTSEHVLSNPGVRLASQGGTVDWFRFWLQDFEDPDPTKAEQYKRWQELRKLQQTQTSNSGAAAAGSPTPH
jgi:hypothetical protein